MKRRVVFLAVAALISTGCDGASSEDEAFNPEKIVRPWIISSYTEGFNREVALCVEDFLLGNYPVERVSDFVFAYDATQADDRQLFEELTTACLAPG